MSEGGNTAALVSAPNSASPTGFTNTLLLFGGNRALKPEESKSFTAGFDWQPLSTKGPSYSVSYYHIDYTDRIANPPVQGSPLLIFSQLAALSPFVNTSPTAAQIQDIMTRYPVGNQSIPGSGGAAAIFDSRRQNIASRTAEGLELTLSDDLELGANRLNVFVSANYMLELEDQAAATTATVDRLDTVFNPADLKLRGGASWARSAFSASWFVNYTDSYDNRLVSPAQEVASWLTFDLTGGVDLGDLTPSSAFKGTLVSLAVQNVFDRDPPRVNGGRAASLVAYDPSNASPLGRVVALQLRRAW
jgi:iron complex outermembrane receptor protein